MRRLWAVILGIALILGGLFMAVYGEAWSTDYGYVVTRHPYASLGLGAIALGILVIIAAVVREYGEPGYGGP